MYFKWVVFWSLEFPNTANHHCLFWISNEAVLHLFHTHCVLSSARYPSHFSQKFLHNWGEDWRQLQQVCRLPTVVSHNRATTIIELRLRADALLHHVPSHVVTARVSNKKRVQQSKLSTASIGVSGVWVGQIFHFLWWLSDVPKSSFCL